MRCLVTGATGFVGGHLCERLAAEGHDVVALVRPGSNRSVLKKVPRIEFLEGTIDSSNVFARAAESLDIVFHLAAVTKAISREEFYRVNAHGTRRLVEGLRRGDFKGRFVLLSSLAAGGPALSPRQGRTEADADQPVSHYGRSKRAAEGLLREHSAGQFDWTILRPGAIYGPREHEILEVLKVMNRAGFAVRLGRGVAVQFTHVEDVVDGLVRAAMMREALGKCYYLTDRPVYKFEDVVRLASEALRKRIRLVRLPLVFGSALASSLDLAGRIAGKPLSPLGADKIREMRRVYWIAEPRAIEQDLGWEAKWGFPEGLRETIAWYRANDWL